MTARIASLVCVTLVVAFANTAHADPDKNPDAPDTVSVIERGVPPPEPARPVTPVVAPPVVEGAPLPGNESGRIDAGDGGDSGGRRLLRGALFIPKVALNLLLFPIGGGIYVEERYHVSERYRRTFFSPDKKIGIYPTAWYESGFGVTVGAHLFNRDLFGQNEALAITALAGGNFYNHGEITFRTGNRLGDRLELEFDARYDRRPQEYFFGIGNADEVSRPDMLIDPFGSEGAVKSRFRQRRSRGTVIADVLAWKSLHVRGAGSLFDATYAPPDQGRPIDHVYETAPLVGFDEGVSQLYTELELRWDTRGPATNMEPPALFTTGTLAAVYGGRASPTGDDGTGYWRYGLELQQFFRISEAPRAIALRFHGEGVSGSTDEVPFAELPRLGGTTFLRGYNVDRFRDRVAAVASAEYSWDLARFLSASLFVDVGRVYSSLSDLDVSNLRVGYGVGLQAHSFNYFLATLSVASSIDGDVFLNLSFNPVFDLDERVRRRWINHHLLLVAAVAGCSAPPPATHVRFANAPAVRVVDDRKNVATVPAYRDHLLAYAFYRGVFQRRMTRALEVPRSQRAHGTNALDEVPDSTWFTNRIGVRTLTNEELQAGPITIDSPELHKPWTIQSTKSGGTAPGFIFTDARGIKFLMKFDAAGLPEMATAAQVIVGKLLWACGYNVPEDFVVYFSRSELQLAGDAVISDPLGDERLDDAELTRRLALYAPAPDGRVRAVASRWVVGKSVGEPPLEGVRSGDPNDVIPHELRRDLRGSYPIFAWLQHGDIQGGNFVDSWVEDPRDPQRHYLEHYIIDFGDALGAMALRQHDPRRGYEYIFGPGSIAWSFVTLGLVPRSWEGRRAPGMRGVGLYDLEFNPGTWKPDTQVYVPFRTADRIDKFWGAKILMRFTRDQLHAIVETGRLTDPKAVEYLTDTLVDRQRTTARYWFSKVNPLDRWRITESGTGPTLCFDDLLLTYGLAPVAPATTYSITGYGRDGAPLSWHNAIAANVKGRTCAPVVLASTADAYTIVQITTRRPGFSGTTLVHVARDPATPRMRVIGVWRR